MKTSVRLVVVGAFLLAAAGCGRSASPIAPDSAGLPVTASPPAAGAAAISGVILGAGVASSPLAVETSGLTVTVVGTSISAAVDSSGRFTLRDVPAGDVRLQFSATGVSASMTLTAVGANDRIQITVTITGSTANLEAQQRTGSDNRVELEGKIQSINTSARSLQVAGATVMVPNDAIIRHGSQTLTFADLTADSRIHVRGTLEGAAVRAATLEVQNQNPPRGNDVELEGTVSGLTGSCPVLTFTVKGTTVKTSAATKFEDGNCTGVRNTVKVEVKGTRQSDGSVLASKVEVEDDEVELEGTVSGLTGSCPTLTFTVKGTTVKTSAATRFEDGSCTGVRNGAKVEVKGTRQSDGSVLASKVEVEDDEVELEGTVSGLTGSCPTLTFTVKGTTVKTSAATRFEDGICTGVRNTVKVEVKGTRQSDGSVLASKVEVED